MIFSRNFSLNMSAMRVSRFVSSWALVCLVVLFALYAPINSSALGLNPGGVLSRPDCDKQQGPLSDIKYPFSLQNEPNKGRLVGPYGSMTKSGIPLIPHYYSYPIVGGCRIYYSRSPDRYQFFWQDGVIKYPETASILNFFEVKFPDLNSVAQVSGFKLAKRNCIEDRGADSDEFCPMLKIEDRNCYLAEFLESNKYLQSMISEKMYYSLLNRLLPYLPGAARNPGLCEQGTKISSVSSSRNSQSPQASTSGTNPQETNQQESWEANWTNEVRVADIREVKPRISKLLKEAPAMLQEGLLPVFEYSSESFNLESTSTTVEKFTEKLISLLECGDAPRMIKAMTAINKTTINLLSDEISERNKSRSDKMFHEHYFGQTRLVGPFDFTRSELSEYHSDLYPESKDTAAVYFKYLIEYDAYQVYECELPVKRQKLSYPDSIPWKLDEPSQKSRQKKFDFYRMKALKEKQNYVLVQFSGWTKDEVLDWSSAMLMGKDSPMEVKMEPKNISLTCKRGMNQLELSDASDPAQGFASVCASAVRAVAFELPTLLIAGYEFPDDFDYFKNVEFSNDPNKKERTLRLPRYSAPVPGGEQITDEDDEHETREPVLESQGTKSKGPVARSDGSAFDSR